MYEIFLSILIAFILCVIVSPLVIIFAKKLKLKQTIYEYVDMHNSKKGTPTMGGLSFLIAITITSLIITRASGVLANITIVVTLAYGVLGFLDDFIKIKLARNLGLRAYQKVIGQVAIAIIIGIFVYSSGLVGTDIYIPFTTISLDLGYFIIPFTILVFLATTNSVNLTDGLDGLASGTSLAFLVGFTFMFYILLSKFGYLPNILAEQTNLLIVGGAGIGALLGYLMFNCYPAKIFMGDTGSLALGGLLSCLCIFSKQVLLIPILGACFVLSSVSVIIQVFSFKLTKKRVFLMAPYHHHLEKKGIHETRITFIYIVITSIISVSGILITLLLN